MSDEPKIGEELKKEQYVPLLPVEKKLIAWSLTIALVLMLCDGAVKRGVDVAETMFEDVGEPDEHGETDPAHLETIDELLQVDGARLVLRWMDLNVPLTID